MGKNDIAFASPSIMDLSSKLIELIYHRGYYGIYTKAYGGCK